MLWIVMLLSASVVFVLRRCPDTQLARTLHKHLVELPLARVRRISRTDLIYFLILAALFTAGGDIVAIAGPEFALVYAADLALYFDLLMVAALVAANVRLRMTVQTVRSFASTLIHRGRRNWRPEVPHRTARSKPRAKSADNDSDGSGRGFILAA